MAISAWTISDLAEFCECCMVIEVNKHDKYCQDCANDVCEYLAELYDEQEKVEKGLY